MEESAVEVKKEPRDEYSDLIRSKIFDDDEEEEEDDGGGDKEDDGGDEEEDVPTRPNSPLKSGDKLPTEDREAFYDLVEKAKNAAKKALALKNKQIDECKGEILKMKLENETTTEKYVKYKNMAKQNAEANKDIRTKADLREDLLRKEREKCEKLSEENERKSASYVELEKKVKVLMTRLQQSRGQTDKLDAIKDFNISSGNIEVKAIEVEKTQPSNEKPVEKIPRVDVKVAAGISSKSDGKVEGSEKPKDGKSVQMLKVIEAVMKYEDSDGIELAQPFWKLPSKKKLPEYYKVIDNPMDIAKIREKVEQEEYAGLVAFEKDFTLVWENARKYNKEDSAIFQV